MTEAPAISSRHGRGAPFRLILRAELRRITSRRSVRLLLAAAVLGVLSYAFFQLISHASLSAHTLALDNAKLRAYEAQIRAACLRSQPAGVSVPAGACNIEVPLSYLPGVKLPFGASAGLTSGAAVIGGVGMLFALLAGASFMGGEYQSRVISLEVALEPRRHRLFLAKLLVLTAFLALAGVALELLWLGLGSMVASVVGDFKGFGTPQLETLLGLQGRIIVALALVGAMAFSLTAIVKNTAGSVGIVLVYLLIGERIVAAAFISVSAHLLSNSVAAIESASGIAVTTSRFAAPTLGAISGSNFGSQKLALAQNVTHLSPMEGLFTVFIYAGMLALASAWVFERRDIF